MCFHINIKREKVFLLEYTRQQRPSPLQSQSLEAASASALSFASAAAGSSLGTFSTISYHTGQPTHSPFCRWYRGCPYDDELLSVDALMLTSCKLQHSALIIRAVCENVARAWVENVEKWGFVVPHGDIQTSWQSLLNDAKDTTGIYVFRQSFHWEFPASGGL